MTTKQKIKRFHIEEIKLILFICSTELSSYTNEDLVCFVEDIEGRIEILFDEEYLLALVKNLKLTPHTIQDFQTLKKLLQSYYSSQWHNKMKNKADYWEEVNVLGKSLLRNLDIKWIEPNTFKQAHLNMF